MQSLVGNDRAIRAKNKKRKLKIAALILMPLLAVTALVLGLYFGLNGPERTMKKEIATEVYTGLFVNKQIAETVKPHLTERGFADAKQIHGYYASDDDMAPQYGGRVSISFAAGDDGLLVAEEYDFKHGDDSKYGQWGNKIFFRFFNDTLIDRIYYDMNCAVVSGC